MNDLFYQQFPSLQRRQEGNSFVFLDGPAGTQVPQSVIDGISHYYLNSNANSHGAFITTQETDQVIDGTREKVAAFLGAEGPHTISFGQNMTSLNFSLSRAIGRALQPGDEILITQLDHEANRGPWLTLREQGIIVKEIPLLPEGVLDYEALEQLLSNRTRLIAMGWASNILGTINQVHRVRSLAYRVGAWLLLDAVHYAPHFTIDVQEIGCDFLLCSAYKFYGPHVGLLYARPGMLDRLQPDRLRTTYQHAPYSIETGTLNHAALAGVSAAIDFIASFGKGNEFQEQLVDAMHQLRQYEQERFRELYTGLSAIDGVEVYGPGINDGDRAPTIAFNLPNMNADTACELLAQHHIFAWSGHFYAIRSTEVLGLLESGGVIRMGISGYVRSEDINRTVEVVRELATS
ncbi:MAG: cysteine desulfurase-like protein [Lewinella sp.]|nr:cysteine desulfurase-like protein [Lewinella sp.]